jgi:hypothetical protein
VDRPDTSERGVNAAPERPGVSRELDRWLQSDGERTLQTLIDAFGRNGFVLPFVLLLGVPALPLPTGGATHVMEIVAALLALQLIAGREQPWLPARWRRLELAGPRQQRFLAGLLKLIRRLERISRPRARFLFSHRLTNSIFGLLVLGGTAGAFLAPPFSGLDTLPALGVVVLSLGVLLEDVLIVLGGTAIGAAGIVLEIVLGRAVVSGVGGLF